MCGVCVVMVCDVYLCSMCGVCVCVCERERYRCALVISVCVYV